MLERPSPTVSLAAALAAMAGLLAAGLASALLQRAGLGVGALSYALNIGLQGLFFALPVMLYYRKHPAMMPALRLRALDPLCAILIVLAALAGVLAFNMLTVFWTILLRALGLTLSSGSIAVPQTAPQLVGMLAAVALAPALFEELLFRGLLLPSLEPLGRRRAVLLSGCLFALMHGRPEALPTHLLLGVLLCLLVLCTGSLAASMLYHAVYNGAILLLAFWASGAADGAADALPTFAEYVRFLPATILLLGIWVWLSRAAMRRGMARNAHPLLPATRKRLPLSARALLAAGALLLLLINGGALWRMLPGGGV